MAEPVSIIAILAKKKKMCMQYTRKKMRKPTHIARSETHRISGKWYFTGGHLRYFLASSIVGTWRDLRIPQTSVRMYTDLYVPAVSRSVFVCVYKLLVFIYCASWYLYTRTLSATTRTTHTFIHPISHVTRSFHTIINPKDAPQRSAAHKPKKNGDETTTHNSHSQSTHPPINQESRKRGPV